jgi:AcrR family transcriptional regulator
MPRPQSVNDEVLLGKITEVFREFGYAGTSLSTLSLATGLKKASLYHRFPRGKEQMAAEVLSAAGQWLEDEILGPLRSDADPKDRITQMAKKLQTFYDGGRKACLLNLLSSSQNQPGYFGDGIKATLKKWIAALVQVGVDAGFNKKTATFRAQRTLVLIEGSLVLSRGLGETTPFKQCLDQLTEEMLG